MSTEQVVLVDEQGNEMGLMEKIEAHEKGVLHKAISVIICNENGEMLLQRRALNKYHWPGIWSNACCSHPREDESFSDAAHRRLNEELGFDAPLTEAFTFVYKATDETSGLTEHELDAVFIGKYDGEMKINTAEVESVKWMSKRDVLRDIYERPEVYSYWFKIILGEMQKRNLI